MTEQVFEQDLDVENLLKRDTLLAVSRHRSEVNASLIWMEEETELTEKLIERLASIPKLARLNLDHPFGYYQIPLVTTDFKSQIKAPVKINFVTSDHPRFLSDPKSIALFHPDSGEVFLKEADFTSAARILGWILGKSVLSTFNEGLAEHEIRHGLFQLNLPWGDNGGGGRENIDEGYASAVKFSVYHDERLDRIDFLAYNEGNYDPVKIGKYRRLFQFAQLHGVDDVKLLQTMAENKWWAELYGIWDLDYKRIEANVVKQIGSKGEVNTSLLKSASKTKTEQILDFRCCVWENVLAFLKEHDLEPHIDWEAAIKEESMIRKDIDDFEKERQKSL